MTIVFKSKGLWDRLETRDSVTKLAAVSHVEFGGWFLAKDAETTHVAGKPTVPSHGHTTGPAGRGAQYLKGVNHMRNDVLRSL